MLPPLSGWRSLALREIAANPTQWLGQCETDDVIARLGLFATPGLHLAGALLVCSRRMQMKRFEIIAAAALAGFAGYILFESTKLSIGSFRVPQTGFFPRVLGFLLVLLTLVELLRALRQPETATPPARSPAKAGSASVQRWRPCSALPWCWSGWASCSRHFFSWCCSYALSRRRAGRKSLSSLWSLHCFLTAYSPGSWACPCPPEF